jgi:tight adherence protein B
MMQNLILATGFMLVLVLIALAFMGPNVGKATSRRLGAVKMRHSDSADARVEQQMRKALAARRPMIFTDGRSISRTDQLRLRLAQTGKSWTLQQYMITSASIAFLVMAALWIKGAPMYLALFGGLMLGAGLPHFAVNFLMAKRIKQFTTNFPDAIELLVRGLKSGLPVGETLGMVAKEIPGPVGEEFKMVTEKVVRRWKTLCRKLRIVWAHPNSSFSSLPSPFSAKRVATWRKLWRIWPMCFASVHK